MALIMQISSLLLSSLLEGDDGEAKRSHKVCEVPAEKKGPKEKKMMKAAEKRSHTHVFGCLKCSLRERENALFKLRDCGVDFTRIRTKGGGVGG